MMYPKTGLLVQTQRALAALSLAYLTLAPTSTFAQDAFENPPALQAADFLSNDLLRGPHHTVLNDVHNDGYLNTYVISSPVGEVTAVSTAKVAERVRELNAIAAMDDIKKSDAFADAARGAASGALEGTRQLVTKPVKTLTGAVTGVGRFFQRAADSAKVDERSDAEDTGVKAALGVSSAKRAIAEEFGVDVYSSNVLLQQRLDDMAWTQFAGGMTIKAPLALASGGVGTAISASQTVTTLNQMVMTTSPTDLRNTNRETLETMGLGEDLVDTFMKNSVLTPRQQTYLVGALAHMKETSNRAAFVKFAAVTDHEDLAAFRTRMAAMYAVYNDNHAPIASFFELGQFVAGRTPEGAVVMIVPVDYLVWTHDTASIVRQLNERLKDAPSKHLWVEGLSARTKQELEQSGWIVHDNAESLVASTPN